MPTTRHSDEEHELPCTEAVTAGVLALMTGYSQSLLAEEAPRQNAPTTTLHAAPRRLQ